MLGPKMIDISTFSCSFLTIESNLNSKFIDFLRLKGSNVALTRLYGAERNGTELRKFLS